MTMFSRRSPQDRVAEEVDGEEGEIDELGDEDIDGCSMDLREEGDPEALKYTEEFRVEVIEDLRGQHDEDGIELASDLSAEAPERFLEWVISPMNLEAFQREFWERRPFLIRRLKNRSFYKGWFGKADIEKLLESHDLK